MSTASNYAEIRARFFPPTRPIVKAASVYAERKIKAGLAALKQERIARDVEKALRAPPDVPSSMRQIAEEVAEKYEFSSWKQLRHHRRNRPLVQARHEAWWRCAEEIASTATDIGRFFGFDHSTVLHGIRRHQDSLTPLEQ